ncbi:MAG: hypothetical protein IJ180_08255 [Bacteroidales bacterium]|nr:hypothetical protein [Bacteroidales bacterium]
MKKLFNFVKNFLTNKKPDDMVQKELKFAIQLNSRVAIYIPSTVDVDKTTCNKRQVEKVQSKLSSMFGGATCTQAYGGWLSMAGNLVTEDVTICYAFCTEEQLQSHIKEIVNICLALKKEMSQEAISLEINNKLYFI